MPENDIMSGMKRHLLFISLVVVFAWMGLRPVFHDGLWSAHDVWHQVARLYRYQEAVTDGQLLPMWISNLANGYGYPLFIFSYHWPWLAVLPYIWAGGSIFNALKLSFILGYLISGLAMYSLCYKLLADRRAALLGALLYLWAPYHFLAIYVSAAVGAVWVMAFLPLLFLGLALINEKQLRPGLTLTSLSLAGLVLSHLLSLALLIPFVALFVILLNYQELLDLGKKKLPRRLLVSLAAGVLGLLIVSFYLWPLLKYQHLIRASQPMSGFAELYRSHFVNFSQLVYSKWGFGPVVERAKEGEISFQIGVAQWLAMLGLIGTCLIQPFKKWLKLMPVQVEARFRQLNWFVILGFGIAVILMLDVSQPVWELANQYLNLDYPHRYLMLAVFLGSLAGGLLYQQTKSNLGRGLVFSLLLLAAVYTNRNHVRVNMYTDYDLDLYVRSETTTNTFHEYLPIGADEAMLKVEQVAVWPVEFVRTLSIKQDTKSLEMAFSVTEPQLDVVFPHFALPGMKLLIDGQERQYFLDRHGLISLKLDPGQYQAKIEYEQPDWVKLSKLVSLSALVLLLAVNFNWRNALKI